MISLEEFKKLNTDQPKYVPHRKRYKSPKKMFIARKILIWFAANPKMLFEFG